ncbi:MAG: GlsB/YeaQ/YmgE family stress response membrane protein [Chloroflexota bacterium]
MVDLILWLVLGAVAGWIAGQIMRGGGFGLVGNIIVGIVGSLIGGWISTNLLGLGATGFNIQGLITAVIGAVILLAIVGFVRRA